MGFFLSTVKLFDEYRLRVEFKFCELGIAKRFSVCLEVYYPIAGFN